MRGYKDQGRQGGANYIPFTNCFRTRPPTPCGSPKHCRGGFAPVQLIQVIEDWFISSELASTWCATKTILYWKSCNIYYTATKHGRFVIPSFVVTSLTCRDVTCCWIAHRLKLLNVLLQRTHEHNSGTSVFHPLCVQAWTSMTIVTKLQAASHDRYISNERQPMSMELDCKNDKLPTTTQTAYNIPYMCYTHIYIYIYIYIYI